MKRLRNKGLAYLLPLAIGLITLTAGVAMMYILPEYIISALNETGTFTSATITTATTKVGVVRNLGMAVIVIAIVWIIIAVISGKKGGGV